MNRLKNFMFQIFNNKKYFYGTLVAMLLILTPLAFWIGSKLADKDNKFSVEDITPEEKDNILSEIVKNNPQGVVKPGDQDDSYVFVDGSSSNDDSQQQAVKPQKDPQDPINSSPIPAPDVPSAGPVAGLSADDLVIPNLDEYNYRYTKITEGLGPAFDVCSSFKMYYQFLQEGTTESYEYFDKEHSLYKSVHTRETGDLSSYHLGQYGNDVNNYFYYRGGDFGVKLKFDIDPNYSNYYEEETSSYPVSYPQNDYNLEDYFGPNATITDYYEENGQEYYEITAKYNYPCNYEVEGNNIDEWIVYTVSAQDFEIVEVRSYYMSIEDNNLVYHRKIDQERRSVTYEEVNNEFSFSHEVDLRTLDYASYVYQPEVEFNKLKQYFSQANVHTLYAPNKEVDYIHGKNFPTRLEGERYYIEREFYSANDFGESLYLDVMASRKKQPLIYVSQKDRMTNYNWFSISTYNKNDRSAADMIAEEKENNYSEEEEIKNIDLAISGENYPAVYMRYRDYYENLPVSYPISYPAPISYPVSYPQGTGFYESTQVFTTVESNAYRIWDSFSSDGYDAFTDLENLMYNHINLAEQSNPITMKYLNDVENYYYSLNY